MGQYAPRCLNPNHRAYHYYGGRGITVCRSWHSFLNFLRDMGERPQGLTLGRIDNDRGYSPGNCHWETHAEQHRNTRLTPRNETYASVVIRTHGFVKQVRGRKRVRPWANQFMRQMAKPESRDFPGVRRTSRGRWEATIRVGGKEVYLGCRSTAREAYLLRFTAAQERGGAGARHPAA